MPTRFCVPREITFGWGALSALRFVDGSRAFIVTDKLAMRELGFTEKVVAALKEKGMETMVFDQVEPDPSRDTVNKGYAEAAKFQPDLFIGLGGGSSLDATKITWLFYEHPDMAEMSWGDIVAGVRRRKLREKARFVAIPTTSGTGSEVTPAAVITDTTVEPHLKKGIFFRELYPDSAIVDAELASKMPPEITANTGFDALVHAVECFVLSDPSDMVDMVAIQAARHIFEWLPRAVEKGDNVTAREKMHLASTLAGMAIGNAGLGIVHNLSHQLGGAFHIPHGRGNALMFCYSLAKLMPTRGARLVEIARVLGTEGASDTQVAERFLASIDELKAKVGIPLSIKETGVDEGKFMGLVDKMTENAMEDPQGASGLPQETVKEMLLKAWEGAKITIPT